MGHSVPGGKHAGHEDPELEDDPPELEELPEEDEDIPPLELEEELLELEPLEDEDPPEVDPLDEELEVEEVHEGVPNVGPQFDPVALQHSKIGPPQRDIPSGHVGVAPLQHLFTPPPSQYALFGFEQSPEDPPELEELPEEEPEEDEDMPPLELEDEPPEVDPLDEELEHSNLPQPQVSSLTY